MKAILNKIYLSLFLLFYIAHPAYSQEYYFKFQISNPADIEVLTRIISIDNVCQDTVYAYANKNEYKEFQEFGYDIIPITETRISEDYKMSENAKSLTNWDSYPTYDAYINLMVNFQSAYPDICLLDTIGYSVEGRLLLAVKLSDNVKTDENEAEFFYTSTMHGDETAGFVLMLHLIDSLTSSYGQSERITKMLDTLEIWINPLANPDGTYKGGNQTVLDAIRYNSNSVDLNRNFPDPIIGNHPDGYSWQPETIAMMDFAAKHHFVMSANFHGGVEVVNYPWDGYTSSVRKHPDNDWFEYISHKYADSCQTDSPVGYMTSFNEGITNGGDWYVVYGGRQDYMNVFHGCREVTIEVSDTKFLPYYELINHWNYNKESLLGYMENCYTGIQGLVTDSENGLATKADIEIVNFEGAPVFNDSTSGQYYRLLLPGSYTLICNAEGFEEQRISNVQVTKDSLSTLNIALKKLRTQFIDSVNPQRFELIQNYPNPFNSQTKIQFIVNENSLIQIRIFDINGALVNNLAHTYYESGKYSINWDGKNSFGKAVSSGVYYYSLMSHSQQISKKMLLLR